MPPVTSVRHALDYKQRLQELEPNVDFLMSLYLHKQVTPEIITEAKANGVVGVKSYPHGVTTHSDQGVMSYEEFYPIFEEMQKQDMILNIHGELPSSAHEDITVLNAEEGFLPTLHDIHRHYPKLRIILEHCTSAAAIKAVQSCGPNVAGTITAHHLFMTVDDWAGDPHCFCKPVAKTPADRRALLRAVISGDPKFFFGSDSAPHPATSKRADKYAAGVFTQPYAVGLVVDALEQAIEAGVLKAEDVTEQKLQNFLCEYGRAFYKVTDERKERIVLKRSEEPIPKDLRHEDGEIEVVPFRRGKMTWEIEWK